MVADRYGQGPPVVLLHGQPGSALDWHAVAQLLWDDFSVIVPDRLGYGRTGGVAAGFEQNALALAHLLDDLSCEQAVVAGYSWGGGVAMAFAESFPARTAGLVLAASVAPGERFGWDDRVLAAPILGEALAALTIGAAGRLLGSRWVNTLADRRLSGRAREAVSVLAGLTGARTGAAVWRSFVIEQRVMIRELEALGPRLHGLAAPTGVINGSADHVVPPHVADLLVAAIPGAVHTVLAGAHHLLPHEHPDAVAAAVRQVAARAWPPGAVGPAEDLDGQETTYREG
ncbi:MAG TPA: alpha/beta hydrolase [Candidatus Dormibacteraeota bacterium]|nr:alpha/beta hydrolase [Candidatus Dormibacteraeota bacterium]